MVKFTCFPPPPNLNLLYFEKDKKKKKEKLKKKKNGLRLIPSFTKYTNLNKKVYICFKMSSCFVGQGIECFTLMPKVEVKSLSSRSLQLQGRISGHWRSM